MKKESNGIGENKNSKKINKNNKIISSILAVTMCCQSFVGAVGSDGQLVDSSKETVGAMKCGDDVKVSEDKSNVKENDEDKNENESKKGDAVDKSKCLSSLAKTIAGISVLGVGTLVIYDAIKYVIGIKKFESNAEPPKNKLLKNEPGVTEPKIDSEGVKIGNKSYLTHSIGEKNKNGIIGFKNLVVKIEDYGGILKFVDEITLDKSEILSQVELRFDCEKQIDELSDYSKFIVEIGKGENSFLTYLLGNYVDLTIGGVVAYACKLLENQKNSSELCLVNACVEVEIDGSTIYFLISRELAPYLSEIVIESDETDDEI
ncbi:MAG: hypothetical protein CfP315_0838 [Candidatus Improbicoccus pseudotrichonymphae]|uniref:Uncharacterized protein n=1 Tax=Candidatus Improbicoccus pseudotrichonymphae TaxID=3033792 RepID=A0AA48KYU7_9FIRM|nr:MAG: hypothetical protein CfP315_0838 [Candidatus Improbicoccus pseudotrichonymphae]